MAIPGIVLGLAYMMFFKGSIIYGTIGILIMVNLVHFFASPYLMAYNALNKLNASLEAVGQTLGIPRRRMILDVFIPQTSGTIVEMTSYFFVNCMVTISAAALLANVSHMPLALLISDFDTQMLVECAAARAHRNLRGQCYRQSRGGTCEASDCEATSAARQHYPFSQPLTTPNAP